MISLKYDPPTGGVQISFIIRDELFSFCPDEVFEDDEKNKCGQTAPQTKYNLVLLKQMIEHMIEQA